MFWLPTTPTSGSHKSDTILCLFMQLFFLFWNMVDPQHSIRSCSTASWFDISMLFKTIIMISLVMLYHHTKIYTVIDHILLILHICDSFATGSLNLLVFLAYFLSLPTHSPLATAYLFSLSMSLFLFCLFICFCSDTTYKWNHTAFVFLCLTYFT